MATIVSPLVTGNQVLVKAAGYVKGNIGTYAGLSVITTGPNGPGSTTVFKSTGATSGFFIDLQMVQLHVAAVQGSFGQGIGAGTTLINPSGGGVQIGGVTYDQSVYNYLMDFFAANG